MSLNGTEDADEMRTYFGRLSLLFQSAFFAQPGDKGQRFPKAASVSMNMVANPMHHGNGKIQFLSIFYSFVLMSYRPHFIKN
jgi:hypothetical protein